jgi:hypothetical protein
MWIIALLVTTSLPLLLLAAIAWAGWNQAIAGPRQLGRAASRQERVLGWVAMIGAGLAGAVVIVLAVRSAIVQAKQAHEPISVEQAIPQGDLPPVPTDNPYRKPSGAEPAE